MSNFSFISSEWLHLKQTLIDAEQQVYAAPPYAALLCRKSLEEWVRWLYENDVDLELPRYDTSLNTLMYEQNFKDLLAPSLFKQVNLVRKLGNDAVHTNLKVKPTEALHALEIMHGFVGWVVRVYSGTKVVIAPFDASLLPTESESVKTKKELKGLEDAFLQSQEINRQLKEELERIKLIKDAHQEKVPPPADPNEAITREIYINLLLKESGWDANGHNVSEYPVMGMPTGDGKNNGPGKVDYVLWGEDGKPLAVVEAKRTSRDPRVGQNQAKLYADCLQLAHGQRPVIFYTNGFETWIWDDVEYAPRRIYGFYKKDELALLIQRRTTRKSLSDAPIDTDIVGRYYQIEAIRSVAKVLENRGREALLVMATGSGKTRTAAALVDVLSKCNWAKRILFLADRTALIYQAKNAFTNHLSNLPNVDLTRDKDQEHARVVFSTYQTMINLIDNEFENNQRHFSIGAFDLVIFDEIHRSVYNRYKAIYEYFDAYRIGLTATPKSEADRDTYLLFGLEPGNPTYAYELEQAVEDKFLVPPKGISVPIKFQREGIKYADLSPEEQLKYEEEFADPLTGEFPDEINSTALNNWLFNSDTVDKVLAHVMQNGIKVAGGDRLGKTIIFARSHKHAKFIEARFNIQYPQYKGDFCKVIDHFEEYAFDLIKRFSEKESGPHIAISVDMLDTGIDVPEITNLVFFKPIRSRTKYWQMTGRGTRLCENLFGPGDNKTHFLVFDFCENFEFFGRKPAGEEGTQSKSLSQRLFQERLRLTSLLHQQDDQELKQYGLEIQHQLFQQVQSLNDENFLVRQHWRIVEKYKDPHQWNALDELEIKELIDQVGPLVTETDEDELAKRFDLMCFAIQIALLIKGLPSDYNIGQVKQIVAKLSKKGSVPTVGEKMDLIKQIQERPYWSDITVLKAEQLRKDLRNLIKFIDKDQGRIVYTNFEDEFSGNITEVDVIYGANDLEAYKRRVTQFIQSQKHHLTISKLRMNIPITTTELSELERMLFAQGEIGTREKFEHAYGVQPLGKFIRSIVGLDVDAAKKAFSNFINSPALNPQQIRFVDTIIQYLSVNGVIEAAALFSPPFTDISSNGLIDVFNPEDSAEIISLVKVVNENAMVA
jgi:type I restriction enzyme R subunit